MNTNNNTANMIEVGCKEMFVLGYVAVTQKEWEAIDYIDYFNVSKSSLNLTIKELEPIRSSIKNDETYNAILTVLGNKKIG